MKTSPVLTQQLNPQLVQFRDQNWTYTSHHGVGAELDFPCCYFKRWFMEIKRYWEYE
jgi:hypothetical protein